VFCPTPTAARLRRPFPGCRCDARGISQWSARKQQKGETEDGSATRALGPGLLRKRQMDIALSVNPGRQGPVAIATPIPPDAALGVEVRGPARRRAAPHLHHITRAQAVTRGHLRSADMASELRNDMNVLLSEPA
jgi:hypothetical protein